MSFLLHALLACVASACLSAAAPQAAAPARPSPPPEIERLSKALTGEYAVVETHHARAGAAEWSIPGWARYRPGPDGLSIVEEYESKNPAGPFTAIAVIWWDAGRGEFKHFECETGEPCGVVDDAGRWEGDAVVFTREAERQGRTYRLEARYEVAKAPAEVVYRTRVSVDGAAPITTMTITYRRQ